MRVIDLSFIASDPTIVKYKFAPLHKVYECHTFIIGSDPTIVKYKFAPLY